MPREFNRGSRMADQIQRDLALLIQREIKDPRMTMVTINEAKVSRDLAFADIYFTMLPDMEATEAEKLLNHASGYLRNLLAKGLSSRSTPRLRFHYDHSIANGARISKAINEARKRDSDLGMDAGIEGEDG